MAISHAALLDELVKIGEAANSSSEPEQKGSVGRALRTMGTAAVGGALGYGAAEVMARKLRFFQEPNAQRARAAKIILPILSGTAVMLADRYRQQMNTEYSKVPGYKSPYKD